MHGIGASVTGPNQVSVCLDHGGAKSTMTVRLVRKRHTPKEVRFLDQSVSKPPKGWHPPTGQKVADYKWKLLPNGVQRRSRLAQGKGLFVWVRTDTRDEELLQYA